MDWRMITIRLPRLCTVRFGIQVSIFLLLLVVVSGAAAQDDSIAPKRQHRVPPMPHERKAYDKPAEAFDFAVRKRTTGIESRSTAPKGTPAIPVERYEAALARIKNMPQYSTGRGCRRRRRLISFSSTM
jgi:hypothetical protein